MSDEERAGRIRQILADMVKSPLDWPSIDLHKLLDECEFERQPIGDPKETTTFLRYHPKYRGLSVVIYSSERVHPRKVTHVAELAQEYLRQAEL